MRLQMQKQFSQRVSASPLWAWRHKFQILLACAGFWLLYSIVVHVKEMSPENIGAMVSNSISLSSILILTALGLAITFGVMGVINMAHGDFLMLGAFTAYFFTNNRALPMVVRNIGNWFDQKWEVEFGFEVGLYLAIPISFVVVAFLGYLMEVLLKIGRAHV